MLKRCALRWRHVSFLLFQSTERGQSIPVGKADERGATTIFIINSKRLVSLGARKDLLLCFVKKEKS